MLRLVAAVTVIFLVTAPGVQAQSLRGSPHSINVENREAHLQHYTYLRTPAQVRHFVKKGWLVRIRGDADFYLHGVSYPYARPEVKVFLRRLARQYHAACGERLVVTSLVRPLSLQRHIRNGSDRSVHPTGMAIDMRRSHSRRCRAWLERVLLQLEGDHVLDATKEHYPPHYHVALFPNPYKTYVAELDEKTQTRVALREDTGVDANGSGADASDASATSAVSDASGPSSSAATPADGVAAPTEAGVIPHEVTSGESLWTLARRFGTTVAAIISANALESKTIMPGQVLKIPTDASSASDVVTYRVGPGDSLWSIAREYGTSVRTLKRVNGLDSNLIQPGQTLNVPSGTR